MTATENEKALYRRRHLGHLRRLAERLDSNSKFNIHASANPPRNSYGYSQQDEANAIRWALRQLDPTGAEQQRLDAMTKPLEAAE